MKEKDRNKQLMILINKLIEDKDYASILLIRTMLYNDTASMKKSYDIVTSTEKYQNMFDKKPMPELFCDIGDSLLCKIDTVFEDFVLPKNHLCKVVGIVGYGIDLRTSNGSGLDLRVINSQMSGIFYTAEETRKILE